MPRTNIFWQDIGYYSTANWLTTWCFWESKKVPAVLPFPTRSSHPSARVRHLSGTPFIHVWTVVQGLPPLWTVFLVSHWSLPFSSVLWLLKRSVVRICLFLFHTSQPVLPKFFQKRSWKIMGQSMHRHTRLPYIHKVNLHKKKNWLHK